MFTAELVISDAGARQLLDRVGWLSDFDFISDLGLKSLSQSAELERQQSIGGGLSAKQREESVRPDQNGLGLVVNRQNVSEVGVLERVQNFWQIAMKLSTAYETYARLAHFDPHWPRQAATTMGGAPGAKRHRRLGTRSLTNGTSRVNSHAS